MFTADLVEQGLSLTNSVTVTIGQVAEPGRHIQLNCTAVGNVSLTLLDGSMVVIPLLTVGYYLLPYSATMVNAAGTTATFSAIYNAW